MYLNDLTIYMYAKINNEDDKKQLQLELNNFCKWVCKWQLKINYKKYAVLHFSRKNNDFVYNLDGNIIASGQSEKILALVIDTDISFKEHIYQCVDKTNKMCTIILNNITIVDVYTLVNLYKCYVRPLLDYTCVIYSPHHIYLIDFIENIQHRFTTRFFSLYNYPYCNGLKLCNLELLEL